MKCFSPKMYAADIFAIDLVALKNMGINILFIDIDYTLEPPTVAHPSTKVVEWLTHAKKLGFKIYMISNNSEQRVTIFNSDLQFDVIWSALKPMRRKVAKLITLHKIDKRCVCMIGDQVLTDIYCANRLGLYSILVEPIGGVGRNLRYRLGKLLSCLGG